MTKNNQQKILLIDQSMIINNRKNYKQTNSSCEFNLKNCSKLKNSKGNLNKHCNSNQNFNKQRKDKKKLKD